MHLSVFRVWVCSELNLVHVIPSPLKGMCKDIERDCAYVVVSYVLEVTVLKF